MNFAKRISFVSAAALLCAACAVGFSVTALSASAEAVPETNVVSEAELSLGETYSTAATNSVNAVGNPEWSDYYKHNAMVTCSVTSPDSEHVVRLSSNGSYTGSGSYWYADKYSVEMPLSSTGFPYYTYAATFSKSGVDVNHTNSHLEESYGQNLAPKYTVKGSNDSIIPTSYDLTTAGSSNKWAHGGSTGQYIYFTISYYGQVFDGKVKIPWIGTNTLAWDTEDAYHSSNGEWINTIFYVRTGPNYVSIKANYSVSCASVNGFAFGVGV